MLMINPTFIHRLQELAESRCYEIYFYKSISSYRVDILLSTTIQTDMYSWESINALVSLDIRAIPDGFGAEALEFASYVFDTLETKLLKEINSKMSSKKEHHTMFVKKEYPTYPEIKNVIFNPPATIVFWDDGTKTVVKAQNNEHFDPEKGLSMAIAKKHFGNKGHYFEEIKKWTEKYTAEEVVKEHTFTCEPANFDFGLLNKMIFADKSGNVTFKLKNNPEGTDA